MSYRQKAESELRRGALYVVATPIGNLADIGERALAVLANADLLCAEDTRVSAKLLRAYDMHTPMISLREHNERETAQKIIERLRAGELVAQISDAGTPALCDPGARLVRSVRDAGLPVFAVPGASALLCAFAASGIIADDFYFAGFLPAKRGERSRILRRIADMPYAAAAYETPHRIIDTLSECLTALPRRKMSLARELTKTFESFIEGCAGDILDELRRDPTRVRGEMVLLFHPDTGKEENERPARFDLERLLDLLAELLPTKRAAQVAADICGLPKKDLYERILRRKS